MSKTKINDPGAHHAGSGALIRRFLPYLAKYKMTLFIDLFCAAMTTLCDIILPKIMSTITNSAMGVGITLTADIVLKLAAVYFVLRIIDGAAQYFMSGIGHIMGVHIETDMRRDAFDHLLKLDHTYYNNTKVGTIMGRITNDLFDVTEFAHHCPEEFFIAGIKIIASFLILCQASVPLTLAVFACVPLMGIVSVKLNQRLRARFRQQRIQIGELNATIEDSLLGQGVVKAFAAEDEEREKFAKGNKDFEHIKTLGYYAMAAFNTSTRLFDGLMYLVVILAGYTKEMEVFLTANSGLASRFPNKIEFPDYTGAELYKILCSIARSKGYTLDAACELPLVTYFDRKQAEDAATNGNGRMARNTLEKAIFHQSRRLVAEPAAELDVILPSDLELEEE